MRYGTIFLPVAVLLLLSCGLIKKEPVAAMPVTPEKQASEVEADNDGGETVPDATIGRIKTTTNFSSTTIRSQEETNREYGYAFDRGTAARIESGDVRPRTARPGTEVQLVLTYVILTHAKSATDVREIREIWFKDKLWERMEVETERMGGTYRSAVPFHLPGNTEKGTYRVVYIVQTPRSRDLREAVFVVGAAKPVHRR